MTHECLRSISRDFDSIKAAADRFFQWANEKLQEQDEETELEVETTLRPKRRKKKVIRPGEIAHVETVTSLQKTFEISVHNSIMVTFTETRYRRFLSHGTLYSDLSLLDLRNFSQVKSSPLPRATFQELSKCLLKFNTKATAENLLCKLDSFAQQWKGLKMSPLQDYETRTVEVENVIS